MRSDQGSEQEPVWDSGKIRSEESVHIPYGGPKLRSRDRILWKVRTWDNRDQGSPWSDKARWEMGLLDNREWKGTWIGAARFGGPQTSAPCPFLRKSFVLRKNITSARLYVTALGLYEGSLNGRRIGDAELTPGWTDYSVRVPYQTHDVTHLLRRGRNVLGFILGDGWYCGHVGWCGRQVYGDRPRLLAQLEVHFSDGSIQQVLSDESWKWNFGPILESDLLMGESYDARHELSGWNEPHFEATDWFRVQTFDAPAIQLVAPRGPRVRAMEELRPIQAPTPGAGFYGQPQWIFDLGQNMVGRVRLKIRGKAGATIRLRYAEMLQADGTLYTTNLREARATDYYTLRGGGMEVYEPRFTFHGFRYVELTGCSKMPGREAITGIVLHSDTPSTGVFECSHPLVNQLQSNIRWGQKGNFLEVPTDCPQRNERLGWTGDAQVFARTAAFNMDVASFFTKWQQDMADSQSPNGFFPQVAPDVLERKKGDGGPAWADAGILCPWTIYLCYGDRRILERHYASLRRFVRALETTSNRFLRAAEASDGFDGFGDHLAADNALTPRSLVGTAYFARSVDVLAKIARILGRTAEAHSFAQLSIRVKAAFNRKFVLPGARVQGDTQTGYLLALAFDLLPKKMRAMALEHLIQNIQNRNDHLSTGIICTSLLAPVLSRFGRTDVAYRLLLQESHPSWLHPVTQGATTMWEYWDGWSKKDGFRQGDNSHNHYAYGAIGEWMYTSIGGIDLDPNQPGYKHILIRPQPGGNLTWARASLRSQYGTIASAWKISEERLQISVTVPPNATATIHLPTKEPKHVTESGRPLACDEGLRKIRTATSEVICEVGSGHYEFSMPQDVHLAS
jgi:alpha-L-rhamnosidase